MSALDNDPKHIFLKWKEGPNKLLMIYENEPQYLPCLVTNADASVNFSYGGAQYSSSYDPRFGSLVTIPRRSGPPAPIPSSCSAVIPSTGATDEAPFMVIVNVPGPVLAPNVTPSTKYPYVGGDIWLTCSYRPPARDDISYFNCSWTYPAYWDTTVSTRTYSRDPPQCKILGTYPSFWQERYEYDPADH